MKTAPRLRVIHVTPTFFSPTSVVGGAERYASELAKAMATEADAELVTFGDVGAQPRQRSGALRIRMHRPLVHLGRDPLNPVAPGLVRSIAWADVIHCHQFRTVVTDLAVLVGRALRKRVFVSDLGGGARYALSYHAPVERLVNRFLLISQYSARFYAPERSRVIYGGVDTERFSPVPVSRGSKTGGYVLYVGRLLPHKGIDYLIEAVDSSTELRIIGRPYHPRYFALLQERAAGKRVRFMTGVSDDELVEQYRGCAVAVLPSVYRDALGGETQVPELLGQTLLEAMACGRPVIGTSVASLPEVVRDGETGFLVPPNSAEALADRIHFLLEHVREREEMGYSARLHVLERFTWGAVVERCLHEYRSHGALDPPRLSTLET